MVNTKKLQGKMKEHGFTIEAIAEGIGITTNGFFNKLHNKTEFRASEIMKLNSLLSLSADETNNIFFTEAVE